MTKDEKIAAARAMLEAMGLTADDLAEVQSVAEPTIDDILPVVNQPWVPEYCGELCWSVLSYGVPVQYGWDDDTHDRGLLSTGNVFPTKEAAEARVQAMRDWEWLKQRSDRCGIITAMASVNDDLYVIPGTSFSTSYKRDAAEKYIGPERLEVLARWLHNLGDE